MVARHEMNRSRQSGVVGGVAEDHPIRCDFVAAF
jgi:hypothetical protein